jgi:hypothetical protein
MESEVQLRRLGALRQVSGVGPGALLIIASLAALGCGAGDDGGVIEEASAALRDRTRPTTPANFRVTATTSFSVSLEWGASSDNSGQFSYVLASTAGGPNVTLSKTATSTTWTTNIAPRNDYTFLIYARDAAGNTSGTASVSTRTPADTVAPQAPTAVSIAAVGATYVSLSWTPAVDNGPFVFYQVWRDGTVLGNVGSVTSYTVHLLEPETTYTFAVRAYDYGPNYSPLSAPVTVTTTPPNPADTQPPSVPANLRGSNFGTGDGETLLRWDPSTDNVDAPALIRYDVYVNGVLSDVVIGGTGRSTVYGVVGQSNLFEVIASDTAGNHAAPATLTLFIDS